jgi:hypothetical protein
MILKYNLVICSRYTFLISYTSDFCSLRELYFDFLFSHLKLNVNRKRNDDPCYDSD